MTGAWRELITVASCYWCQAGRLCYIKATAAEKGRFAQTLKVHRQTPSKGRGKRTGPQEQEPTEPQTDSQQGQRKEASGEGTNRTPLEREVKAHILPFAQL